MREIAVQVLICLTLAHVIGDFLLQSDEDAARKKKPLILLKHSCIVALLSYSLCGAWSEWRIPFIVLLTHIVIDYIKGTIEKQGVYTFLLDQAAHITVLVFIANLVASNSISLFWLEFFGASLLKVYVYLSGAIVAIKAVGILVGLAVQPLLVKLKESRAEQTIGGFENGGQMIGQLERALIFLLVLVGQPGGIGFLIAAKSILRFGEVREHQQRMEAEYIIIGTLMSFGYGILIAYLTHFVAGHL